MTINEDGLLALRALLRPEIQEDERSRVWLLRRLVPTLIDEAMDYREALRDENICPDCMGTGYRRGEDCETCRVITEAEDEGRYKWGEGERETEEVLAAFVGLCPPVHEEEQGR